MAFTAKMMILKRLLLYFTIFLIQACANGDNSGNANMGNGVLYFSSFTGKVLPYMPVQPIDENEAKKSLSYLMATYEDGRLIELKKILNGKLFFTQKIVYGEDGTMSEAFLTIFDAKGDKEFHKRFD
jgi:hypothetical protein